MGEDRSISPEEEYWTHLKEETEKSLSGLEHSREPADRVLELRAGYDEILKGVAILISKRRMIDNRRKILIQHKQRKNVILHNLEDIDYIIEQARLPKAKEYWRSLKSENENQLNHVENMIKIHEEEDREH